MAWTNIFDLAEWDVFVRFRGTSAPSPDSVEYLVRAEDLDPAVGTVTVEDGVIVCDLEPLGSGSGVMFEVVVMPIGTGPSGPFRVTGVDDGFPLQVPGGGGHLKTVESLTSEGTDIYQPVTGSVDDSLEAFVEITEIEASAPCPSGEGLSLELVRGGG